MSHDRRSEAPPRILVIDDRKEVLSVLRRLLKRMGFEAATSQYPYEGLSMLLERKFSLVLLDVVIPGHPARETIDRIQRVQPDIPILLMTGGADEAVIEEAQTLGAHGPLRKPVGPEELEKAVLSLLKE